MFFRNGVGRRDAVKNVHEMKYLKYFLLSANPYLYLRNGDCLPRLPFSPKLVIISYKGGLQGCNTLMACCCSQYRTIMTPLQLRTCTTL